MICVIGMSIHPSLKDTLSDDMKQVAIAEKPSFLEVGTHACTCTWSDMLTHVHANPLLTSCDVTIQMVRVFMHIHVAHTCMLAYMYALVCINIRNKKKKKTYLCHTCTCTCIPYMYVPVLTYLHVCTCTYIL